MSDSCVYQQPSRSRFRDPSISKHSNHSQDHGRVLPTHQQQPNNNTIAPWGATCGVATSDPSTGWSTSDQPTTQVPRGKRRTTGKEKCRTWSFSRWYHHSIAQRYSGCGGVHIERSSDASCIRGAVTRLWNHALISPICDRLYRVVFVRLHDCAAKLTLRPFPTTVGDGQIRLHSQCLGVDVGGVVLAVHFHQSEAPLLECYLAPECFDIEMLHPARLTLRHHAASCGSVAVYTHRKVANG